MRHDEANANYEALRNEFDRLRKRVDALVAVDLELRADYETRISAAQREIEEIRHHAEEINRRLTEALQNILEP